MLANAWLAVRNLAMIVVFPGTVAIYIPYRLLTPIDVPRMSQWSLYQYPAALLILFGTGILLSCIWSFARIGRGTLAPFDETRRLIVVGLYRYLRNPMYIGVTLILLGQSWFFWSDRLLIYAGIVFVAFNTLVIAYEENRLRYKYGNQYRRYCNSVGRWLPGRPYRDVD